MSKRELSEREIRRKKRIRSQILAYITLFVLLVLVFVGGFFGVRAIGKYLGDYNDRVAQALAEAEEVASQGQTEQMQEEQTQPQTQEQAEAEENPLDELIEALLADMTIEEKVAGMFMVTPESITGVTTAVQAKEGTKTALGENPVGGIIYSEKNYKSDEQFLEMLTNTRSYSKYPVFLAVSKECGNAESFGIAATATAGELTSAESVQEAYRKIGEQLTALGVTMNLAPVADVVSEEGNTALQGRTFGSDAQAAAPLVWVAAEALQETKVSAVLQKFPGEGALDESGVIAKSLEELKNSDFITYQLAIQNGVDGITVSNVKAPALTGDDTPCSLSSVIITDILRGTLGYDGIVLTDHLSDSIVADNYTPAQAAVAAIQAGADMLVTPTDYQAAYEGVLQAIADGTITQERIEESMYRIYRVKYKDALEN